MQPAASKPDLPFLLGLIGAVFGIGQGAILALIVPLVLGAAPGSLGVGEFGILLAIFGWIALMGALGGAIMLAAALRMRKSADPRERQRHGGWMIAGGVVTFLGGNVLAAGLGIAGGAVALSSPQPVASA